MAFPLPMPLSPSPSVVVVDGSSTSSIGCTSTTSTSIASASTRCVNGGTIPLGPGMQNKCIMYIYVCTSKRICILSLNGVWADDPYFAWSSFLKGSAVQPTTIHMDGLTKFYIICRNKYIYIHIYIDTHFHTYFIGWVHVLFNVLGASASLSIEK